VVDVLGHHWAVFPLLAFSILHQRGKGSPPFSTLPAPPGLTDVVEQVGGDVSPAVDHAQDYNLAALDYEGDTGTALVADDPQSGHMSARSVPRWGTSGGLRPGGHKAVQLRARYRNAASAIY
jgi:hypothetical protein